MDTQRYSSRRFTVAERSCRSRQTLMQSWGHRLTQWCVTPPASEHCGSIWCVHGLLVTVNRVWNCMLWSCNWSLVGACLRLCVCVNKNEIKWNELFYSNINYKAVFQYLEAWWLRFLMLLSHSEENLDMIPGTISFFMWFVCSHRVHLPQFKDM